MQTGHKATLHELYFLNPLCSPRDLCLKHGLFDTDFTTFIHSQEKKKKKANIHVGFVMEEKALGEVFLRTLEFSYLYHPINDPYSYFIPLQPALYSTIYRPNGSPMFP
jgi:hypothetical protein